MSNTVRETPNKSIVLSERGLPLIVAFEGRKDSELVRSIKPRQKLSIEPQNLDVRLPKEGEVPAEWMATWGHTVVPYIVADSGVAVQVVLVNHVFMRELWKRDYVPPKPKSHAERSTFNSQAEELAYLRKKQENAPPSELTHINLGYYAGDNDFYGEMLAIGLKDEDKIGYINFGLSTLVEKYDRKTVRTILERLEKVLAQEGVKVIESGMDPIETQVYLYSFGWRPSHFQEISSTSMFKDRFADHDELEAFEFWKKI